MSSALNYYIYDLETMPNFFSFTGKFEGKPEIQTFEISSRKNQRNELLSWLSYLQNCSAHMVGYNNLGFDYPIIHELLNNIYTFTYETAYNLCQQIINSNQYGFNTIYHGDRIIAQIDLMKINHFDNANKRTPLKSLQVAMRSASVEDMPIKPGTIVTPEQMDIMINYNIHDVTETEAFLQKCKHLIEMRKELLDNGILSGDALNFSDVKIGTEYLIKRIGRAKCFHSGNKPKQTLRKSIEFKDIILPKIFYRTEAFQNVLQWFKEQIIYPRSGIENPKFEARLADLDFYFGVGGLHASVENKRYESTSTHVIKDIDVTSMYPSIAITNGFAPEHLGKDFSDAYKQLVEDRKQYKKGTSMNAVLKLASNGAFGNGDNEYSCFYDPLFPKQIVINGQLQILQLAEILSLIPGLEIIQVNTDGITAYLPRSMALIFEAWKKDWESHTGLRLEEVEYSKMWIRDVNNYLCLMTNGYVKRKGAYWYPVEAADYDGVWNKDFSMMVVPKTIEHVLVNDWREEHIIKLMTDPFDFMIRYKTPAGATVYIGEKEMLKTVRYYVSVSGEPMKKVAKPKGEVGTYKRKNKLANDFYNKILLEIEPGTWDERIHTKNKSRYEIVTTGIESGRLVKECNVANNFNWNDVDWEYYIEEVRKLYIGEKND